MCIKVRAKKSIFMERHCLNNYKKIDNGIRENVIDIDNK